MTLQRLLLVLALGTLAFAPAAWASEGCTPFLCYFDAASGGTICPNGSVYTVLRSDPVVNTSFNPDCDASCWKAAVIQVDVPAGCKGIAVWAEYDGDPEGWTLNVADSPTNNGYGGDAGSAPAGQNAELQVLDDVLSVYAAISGPPTILLGQPRLILRNGALRVIAENQFVSWGQPYSSVTSTEERAHLFSLPDDPVAPENRTLYVGFNRVISPIGGQNTTRNGCGLRRAIITVH